jgi:hypothetical protein
MRRPLCDALGRLWGTAGCCILSKIAGTPDRERYWECPCAKVHVSRYAEQFVEPYDRKEKCQALAEALWEENYETDHAEKYYPSNKVVESKEQLELRRVPQRDLNHASTIDSSAAFQSYVNLEPFCALGCSLYSGFEEVTPGC